MGALRDKPALAVGLLIVALVALAFSLFWTFRQSSPPPPPPSGSAPATPPAAPPTSPDGTGSQTVPY
ncbi:MAG: hypothetical protein NZM28_04425 [Fimbriimonadales bacterium]|nr:hypothetical protein [Fimbriimonadales bacterium]